MTRIVRASPGQRETVLALVERLLKELEDRPNEFEGIDRNQVLQAWREVDAKFTAFLALAPSGEAVGVATLMEVFAIYAGGWYGVIDEMYVAPEYRSQGVGRQLLEAVKGHGRARGWMRLDVTAPPEKKWERTVAFYEQQGFVFTGPKLRLRL